MSIYSVIGIALLLLVSVAGIISKIVLRRRRKLLDGFHGFVNKKEIQSKTDEWELL